MPSGKAGTPVWAAIHTPFAPTLELDEPGLRRNVGHYIRLGLTGVFCNGLIGEVWSLTLSERKRIVEILIDEAGGRLDISAVISASSIEETLELGIHAKRTGAAHAVVIVPNSGPRSREQQFAYIETVCQRLDMPIVLFNAAGTTGSPLSVDLFSDVCALPQITILKSTAYNHNASLRKAARGPVIFSDPLEEHYLENRLSHDQPILYADPEPYLYQSPASRPIGDYMWQLDTGQVDEATGGHRRLAPLRLVFNKWVMDPLMAGHMPNAAVKHWCDMMGMAGGAVRMPIRALTPQEKHILAHDVRLAFEHCSLPVPDAAYT